MTKAQDPSDADLHAWTDALARQHFGVPFDQRACWAKRLHHRAGDYHPISRTLRLSLPYFQRYGRREADAVLLHELCHWWLYRHGQPHRENDPAFQALLRLHGAPRRARALDRPARVVRIYACPRCGRRYPYTRRVDYACGACCRLHAGGRYDPRFRLIPADPERDQAGRVAAVDAPAGRNAASRANPA